MNLVFDAIYSELLAATLKLIAWRSDLEKIIVAQLARKFQNHTHKSEALHNTFQHAISVCLGPSGCLPSRHTDIKCVPLPVQFPCVHTWPIGTEVRMGYNRALVTVRHPLSVP